MSDLKKAPAESRIIQSKASLALVPSTAASTSSGAGISHVQDTSKLNAQGLHDTLTYGPYSVSAQVAPQHPLEHRLTQVRGGCGHRPSLRHLRVQLAVD